MPEIPLTRGLVTLVDDIDFERFGFLRWHTDRNKYAIRTVRNRMVYLQDCIMDNAAIGGTVDHINRDRLDNRRINLRITTRSANNQNSFQRNNTTKMRGVTWNACARKWMVQLSGNYFGVYEDIETAAYVYNQEAVRAYGPHAYQNKLPDGFIPKERKPRHTISGYRGVAWDKSVGKWHVKFKGKHCGTFLNPELAAYVFNKISIETNGPDAFVNKLPPDFVPSESPFKVRRPRQRKLTVPIPYDFKGAYRRSRFG